MRKKTILIILAGLLLALPVAGWLVWGTVNATSKNITQAQAEQLALQSAYQWGLVGEPTSVQSKLVSRDELKARLNTNSAESYFADPQSWLVVFKGKVIHDVVHSPGNPGQQEFDNVYVTLSVGGVEMATGSCSPAYYLNLACSMLDR